MVLLLYLNIMLRQVRIYLLTGILFLVHAHLSAQEFAPSKTAYKSGEDIVLTFSGGPGNQKDWIAIYKKGGIPGEVSSLRWSYLDGTDEGTKT